MKKAVINYSGNVGKSTIVTHLLAPRMPGAPVFEFETVNANAAVDGMEIERIKSRHFGQWQEQLIQADSAIVDIGSSNAEEFMKRMAQYDGSHEEFDYFIVPVITMRKQQGDTINIIRDLKNMGVPKEKIRVIFNMVDVDQSVEDDFAALFGLAKKEKSFVINPKAVIYENEVFPKLKAANKTLKDLLEDPTDWRALLSTLPKEKESEREHCARMISLQRVAKTARRNLDMVYETLFA